MEGLKNALEYLVGVGKKSGEGTTFHPQAEPSHIYYLNKPDGPERVEADLPPKDHKALSLASLVVLAVDYSLGSIWYSRHGVIATGERDRVTLTLSPSPQLKELASWDERGKGILKQTELILKLRTLFADCVPDHPNLLESVRRIDVKKGQDVQAEVRTGKVSMGRSMMAEITGLDKLPETIVFRVPIFAEAAFPSVQAVRVALDPDPVNEQFAFIPFPGDIERAYAEAELALWQRLEQLREDGNNIGLYHGKP